MSPSVEALPRAALPAPRAEVGSEVWVEVARWVLVAEVLPGLRMQGGAGGASFDRWVTSVARQCPRLGVRELAGVLVDARRVAGLVASSAAGRTQRAAARSAGEAVGSVPAEAMPEQVARRAVTAAGTVGRLRCLAGALTGTEHAAAVDEHTVRLAALWAEAAGAGRDWADWAAELLPADVLADARAAAVARAASAALAEREPQLVTATQTLGRQLQARATQLAAPAADGAARLRARLRARLAAAAAQRQAGAAELTRKLLAAAGHEPAGGARTVARAGAVPAPAAAARVDRWVLPRAPADRRLLAWLQARTGRPLYESGFEQAMARRWLGSDPFGLRALPDPPPFLAGVPIDRIPAEQVAPLLRRLNLTCPAPTADRLTAPAPAADPGAASVARRSRRRRRWGQFAASTPPLLPRTTRIPHVVHGIWLGKPLPAGTVFWRNYAAGARRYAGRVDFVLWTDIPRHRFTDALTNPPPPAGQPDPHAEVRAMAGWARDNGILLANVTEVFHAQAPMRLHPQFVLEMSKQLPRGYASASDILRVEIVHRFGGLYADGDMSFIPPADEPLPETLPQFFDRLTASTPAFTMNPLPDGGVRGDALAGPARHPALALWLEMMRLNYFRTQVDVLGGLRTMAKPYVGHPWQEYRYLAPHRTGGVQSDTLPLLGMNHPSLPATKPAVQDGREFSWLPPAGGEPVAADRQLDADEVIGRLARCVTVLEWQLAARDGDLYLSAVDPVIAGLPDPDAAWSALLNVLPALFAGHPPVTSVTDLRRNDDGHLHAVPLPPEAGALLIPTRTPIRWLAAPISPHGQPTWLLDERVTPITLHTPHYPAVDPLHRLIPLTDITLNAFGHPIGVWIRAPHHAHKASRPGFATIPPGHFAIHVGTGHPDSLAEVNPHPEALAGLLLHLHATNQPVHLVVPPTTAAVARPLATALRRLLRQPIHLTEQPTNTFTALTPHPHLPPIHHIALGALVSSSQGRARVAATRRAS